MSHLIALVFDDEFKGEGERAALQRMPLKVCLVGTLAGQLRGRLRDDGITRKFIRDLK